MRKNYRKIQFLSNIATIVIAILLCVVTVKLFYPSTPNFAVSNFPKPNPASANSNPQAPRNAPQPTPVGQTVPLENIDWKANKKTLILYLSTTCRFCNESSPFYKRLVEKYANDKSVKVVAVLPQPVDEAKQHLKDLGVNINDVYNGQLRAIGVSATPTLLLVDESGVVSDHWKGKLQENKETEVLSKLMTRVGE